MSDLGVIPRLHPRSEVASAVAEGMWDSPAIKETIAALAMGGMWKQLWDVADSMSREVSILLDSQCHVWVDVGTAGQVRLSPPMGATIPFRLWVHTHPKDAYWSSTDLGTLAACSTILEEALVLGHDHCKRAMRPSSDDPVLGTSGPLSEWTSESCRPYSEVSIVPIEGGGESGG